MNEEPEEKSLEEESNEEPTEVKKQMPQEDDKDEYKEDDKEIPKQKEEMDLVSLTKFIFDTIQDSNIIVCFGLSIESFKRTSTT